jgi:hypothetical protein
MGQGWPYPESHAVRSLARLRGGHRRPGTRIPGGDVGGGLGQVAAKAGSGLERQ